MRRINYLLMIAGLCACVACGDDTGAVDTRGANNEAPANGPVCSIPIPEEDADLPEGIEINRSGTVPALGVPTDARRDVLAEALGQDGDMQEFLSSSEARLATITAWREATMDDLDPDLGIVATYAFPDRVDLPTKYGAPVETKSATTEEPDSERDIPLERDQEGLPLLSPIDRAEEPQAFTKSEAMDVFVTTVKDRATVHFVQPTSTPADPCENGR